MISMSSGLPNKIAHHRRSGAQRGPSTRSLLYLELVAGTLGVAYLIYTLRSMLILKESMLIHDHFYWGYPIFQYYAENIIHGCFPLWNPFTHGGEPFYPAVLQIRLLEPTTLFMIYLWKWLHIADLVTLYNWINVVQIIIMVLGIYLLFRTLADNIFIRISLIPILLFSSFMFASFRQPAPLHQFMWAPYIAYFLLRLTYHRDYRWHNWFMLGGLLGINWQSYFFSGVWIFCLFFLVGLLLFRRELLWGVLQSNKFPLKLAVTLTIVLAMMLPNLVLMLEKDKYVFSGRMAEPGYETKAPMGDPQQIEGSVLPEDDGIFMPYRLITHTGSFSSIWDFIQIIYPDRNGFVAGPKVKTQWGKPSEAYMYIGLLPWAIALLGFVAGEHDLKQMWLVIALGYGLLMLGPAGGLHGLLYYIYPPLWFTRHTHGFVFFFLFAFLYFYVLGFNHIFASWNTSLFPSDAGKKKGTLGRLIGDNYAVKHLPLILSSTLLCACMVYAVYLMTKLHYPQTNYLFVLVLGIFLFGWLLRNDLRRMGIFAALILGYVIFALISCKNDESRFLVRCLFLLVLPLTLFFWARTRQALQKKRYMVIILMTVFSASLAIDLGYHLRLTRFLYRTQPHPADIFNVMTNAQEPKLVEHRRSVSLSVVGATIQSLRYVSLVYRQPYAFSPLVAADKNPANPYPHTVNNIAEVLQYKRWNSFFLLKNYFQLVNSGIPPSALEEMFCVGKSLFQFKEGVVAVTDGDPAPLFNRLGPKASIRLLKECVVVDGKDMDHSLAEFRVSEAEYETPGRAETDAHGDASHFSYRVRDYEYDSFSMDVVTDKDGLLYWSDGFDDRWHAYVDGQEVPIYRANMNFKAIILSKGVRHIRFVYEHTLFRRGLVAFFGTFGLALIMALIVRSFSNKRLVS